jgi:hypothetical protein
MKIKIYRHIILPGVPHGCETWSLILRQEQRLMESDSRVLRKVFESKTDKLTGEWETLYNEQLYAVFSSPATTEVTNLRGMTWVGHIACIAERRGAYRVLVGKSEELRPLGRYRHRWDGNIKRDL